MTLVSTATAPHAARLDPATYPIHDTIGARYGDMDANGHLNNLALEALHENARATLNVSIFPEAYARDDRRLRIVTASNVVHFLREAHWPNMIHTGAGIGRIGRTSYVASTALFVDGTCVGLCDAVLVVLDHDGPTPIPAAARERLTELLLPTE